MIRTIKDLLKPEIIDDSIEVLGQSKRTTKGFESKRTQHSKTLFSPINLTASEAKLARMPSAVLSTLEASSDSAEAARPTGVGWVGEQHKVTSGKGRTGVELTEPT